MITAMVSSPFLYTRTKKTICIFLFVLNPLISGALHSGILHSKTLLSCYFGYGLYCSITKFYTNLANFPFRFCHFDSFLSCTPSLCMVKWF